MTEREIIINIFKRLNLIPLENNYENCTYVEVDYTGSYGILLISFDNNGNLTEIDHGC